MGAIRRRFRRNMMQMMSGVSVDAFIQSLGGALLHLKSTDYVSGNWADSDSGIAFTEATNPPSLVADALAGYPAVRFDGTNDRLVSTKDATADPAWTVTTNYIVATKQNAAGTGVVLAENQWPGSLAMTPTLVIAGSNTDNYANGSAQFTIPDPGAGGHIFTAAAKHSLNVNGTRRTTYTTATNGWVSSTLTMGYRNTGGGDLFFQGDIFEIIVMRGIHTRNQQRRMRELLAAKYGLTVTETEIFDRYVDPTNGNDINAGTTPGAAYATLAVALDDAANLSVGILNADENNPVIYDVFGAPLTGQKFIGGVDGETWYCEAITDQFLGSGWTEDGGGVWSRANPRNYNNMFVVNLLDGNGMATYLSSDGTTTTPAEGKFSFSAGTTLHIHLPGAVDPNDYDIVGHRRDYALVNSGAGVMMTLYDGVFRYGGVAALGALSSAGMQAVNCLAERAGSGMNGGGALMVCANTIGQGNGNDGFNINTGTNYLHNCVGRYNQDEGASPHGSSVMRDFGGEYYGNGAGAVGGGLTAANTSAMHLIDTVARDNIGDGIVYGSTTSGSMTDVITRDNSAKGLNCQSASVTVTNLTSVGNGEADDLC